LVGQDVLASFYFYYIIYKTLYKTLDETFDSFLAISWLFQAPFCFVDRIITQVSLNIA